MKLNKLLIGIEHRILQGDTDIEITRITHDSRKINSNECYICLTGKYNGHNYIDDAVANGAVCVIAEEKEEYDRANCCGATFIEVKDTRSAYAELCNNLYEKPTEKLKFIGVVGTNGKTTTANIIYYLLNRAGVKAGVIGTLGSKLPSGEEIGMSLTTPDPDELYRTLYEMHVASCEYAVMEVSAHAIALKKTSAIRFDYLCFTNLSQDHLDFFNDMKAYESVKHSLFVDNDALNVINYDDRSGRLLLDRLNGRNNVTYSVKNCNEEISTDFYSVLRNIKSNVFDFYTRSKECVHIETQMYGAFNAYNATMALAVVYEILGDISFASEALKSFAGVSGRFMTRVVNGVTIVIDYAHTPDGLEKLLTEAKKITDGKLFAVFGAGGDRDRGKRPIMGRIAEGIADKIVLTSDNPRFEDRNSIIADIMSGMKNDDKVTRCPVRYHAVLYALNAAKSGDTVVIAGKGHENYIDEKGIKIRYSDIESVEKVLGIRW